MPKKKTAKKTAHRHVVKKKSFWKEYRRFIVPSVLGGVIAWFFSASLMLGVIVFIAVWVGNWIGREYLEKK